MPSNVDPYTGKPLPPSAMYPQAQGAPPQPPQGISPLAPPPQAGQPGQLSAAEQAQIAALLSTYGDTQEIGALEKQMAAAEALRMATPEGRSSGRVYTAANPLEHLGKGIGDYKLMKQRKANDTAQAEARDRVSRNVQKYGEYALKDL
jgi:hypothetical protein